ncbi:Asp-tRNA(Asn)/Glu-tRNA(Gln) amidotransferase subunit GatC [Deinococcus radiophilus]|uniref:Aspartyl/glutamyl-tRNA(Asn/Gln) amidotransferase subunit C n=1 Tax=Deinococcus radiophilus TaxID=32062 RepID=A0A431VQQ4_9DEIO|nr:Asp-tRNA(Asn)/Glu-tRNA(Gln) amidotransferase subunit GatC [Deinococcus radiophilus]RTR25540.1 Asp-tRNA(Asn)/Glu-tRNA(Gln) amidotransferase subunit GatC [Deinococcus radiophilus]UFA50513.1 Asp-tRNA(Asn)/Glu-tRNA(Gln) amidotransferase subunit GatC [Deinococcus radiophilus]
MTHPVSESSLSTEQLEHLARLARLELKPDEEVAIRGELNELLDYFQQLQAVETEGVEPMQRPLPLSDHLRPDVAGSTLPQAEVVALAPAHVGGLVRLPRTLDSD